MNWQNVRELYPDKWLVFLAVDSETTEEQQRIVHKLAPIEAHADFYDAWDVYFALHKKDRKQELYVFHTSNQELDIKEVPAPIFRVRS